jgi:hypothetical protein
MVSDAEHVAAPTNAAYVKKVLASSEPSNRISAADIMEVGFSRFDDPFSNVLPEGVASLGHSQNRRCFLNQSVGNREN